MTKKVLARALVAVCSAALSVGLVAVQPAAAATLPLNNWEANVKTHVGALVNTDVAIPPGKMNATVDLTTKALNGTLTLPPATFSFTGLGILPITVTFNVDETGPLTGSVDLAANTVTASYPFNVRLSSVKLFGLLELLDPATTCVSVTPTVADLTGTLSLPDSVHLTGNYAIPALQGCGGFNDLVSGFTAGPTNSLDVTVTPPPA